MAPCRKQDLQQPSLKVNVKGCNSDILTLFDMHVTVSVSRSLEELSCQGDLVEPKLIFISMSLVCIQSSDTLVNYGIAVIYVHAVSCFYQMCNHDWCYEFSVYMDREPQFIKLLQSSVCGQNVSVLIVMGWSLQRFCILFWLFPHLAYSILSLVFMHIVDTDSISQVFFRTLLQSQTFKHSVEHWSLNWNAWHLNLIVSVTNAQTI